MPSQHLSNRFEGTDDESFEKFASLSANEKNSNYMPFRLIIYLSKLY